MNTNNRLFLPLKSDAFKWFAEGNKKYELRKLHHQYNRRQVKKDRLVELRQGYSGPSIWGRIDHVLVEESNLHKLFEKVEFKDVIPVAGSIDEAVSLAEKFVGTQGPYILFKILKVEESIVKS